MNTPSACPACGGATTVLRFRPGVKYNTATMWCNKCGHVWAVKEQMKNTIICGEN